MAIADNLKDFANKAMTQAKERHLTLEITSGQKELNMGLLSTTVVIRENADGQIYFDKLNGFYEIVDYAWEGPKYKTLTTTSSQTTHAGKDKAKRKGGLGGAVVGTLLLPGVGTAIGYAMTNKKVTNHKGKENTNVVTNENTVEVKSNAKLTLRNLETGASFVIGFTCDTKLDAELMNFPIARRANSEQALGQQKSSVELLKDYKELLDSGVITVEEFNAKKRELLGL